MSSLKLRTTVLECIENFKLYASQCSLCSNKELVHPLICQHCHQDLPLFNHTDVKHNLLNWPAIDKLFPKRRFEHLHCLSPYIWPVDYWVKQLKYKNHFEVAQLLAFLLNTTWQPQTDWAKSTAVLAVPIHIKKWQKRGYNQAHLIAESFAELSHLEYQKEVLVRNVDGDSQVGQTGAERRKNLRNAFSLTTGFVSLPQRIILIDDVITTGSTVNVICSLLKDQGVQHITVMTAALTLPS